MICNMKALVDAVLFVYVAKNVMVGLLMKPQEICQF